MTSSTLPLRIPPTHVVGIGASAGGLHPLEEFFANMPTDSGAAFVIVQHLSRKFESMMDVLLARCTEMPIHVAEMGTELEANHIYLNSAGKNIVLSGGRLMVTELMSADELHLPIDIFFNSLALDFGARAIAVVLSGAGTDGSRGVRAIHHACGQVLVQEPGSAGFDSMPRSSIGSTLADVIAPPSAMPAQILRFIKEGPYHNVVSLPGTTENGRFEGSYFSQILLLLQDRFKLDFSLYKSMTLERRIERRMSLTHYGNLEAYVDYLRKSDEELDHLYRDMLVDVTRFFRDEEAFKFIEEEVIPGIVNRTEEGEEIRCWVAGCASGEEAYSMGILLVEEMERQQKKCPIRIFATDAHQGSVDRAMLGIFGLDSCSTISPERLRRFFTPVKEGYQATKQLRDLLIFAHQDLLTNPPFNRLDLVSCRNVLIYFESEAQQRLLANFHFCLKINGYLFLGPSEHLGGLEDEFVIVDRKWRIFRKLRDVIVPQIHITMPVRHDSPQPNRPFPAHRQSSTEVIQESYATRRTMRSLDRSLANDWMEALLSTLIPSGLVLDHRSDILYIFGDAQQYLHLGLGYGTLNAFDLLDGELVTGLRLAVAHVMSGQEKVVLNSVQTTTNEGTIIQLRATVVSLSSTQNRAQRIFVGLEPQVVDESTEPKVIEMDQVPIEQIEQLEYELAITRETLQTSIEEQESTNEELTAANEELQASNEELSATNEELFTVNTEYQRSIGELTRLTTDMENLQTSTQIGVLFLDEELTIRQYTPPAAQILGLVEADIGRPVSHLSFFNLSLKMSELERAAAQTLSQGSSIELEAALWHGHYYMLRVLPYINEDRAIEGVVLTVVDISDRKEAELINESISHQLRTITDNIPACVAYVDNQLRVQFANKKMSEYGFVDEDKTIGRYVWEVLSQEIYENCREQMESVLGGAQVSYEMERVTEEDETVHELVTMVPDLIDSEVQGCFMFIFNITEQQASIARIEALNKSLQELNVSLEERVMHRTRELEYANAKLLRSNDELDQFVSVASHDLKEPLRGLQSYAQMLGDELNDVMSEQAQELIEKIVKLTDWTEQLLNELHNYARLIRNDLDIEPIDLDVIVDDIVAILGPQIENDSVRFIRNGPLPTVQHNRAHMMTVFQNLITNALKYNNARDKEIEIGVLQEQIQNAENEVGDREREEERQAGTISRHLITSPIFYIRDNGIGIAKQHHARIFEMFKRLHPDDSYGGGTGAGLALVKRIIEQNGGQIWVESELGAGTSFYFSL